MNIYFNHFNKSFYVVNILLYTTFITNAVNNFIFSNIHKTIVIDIYSNKITFLCRFLSSIKYLLINKFILSIIKELVDLRKNLIII